MNSSLSPRPTTLRAALTATLRERIESGEWAPGERIPSVAALCEQFEVSNITVRAALRELSEAGWLESRRRIGVFVKPRQPAAPDLRGDRTLALVLGGWESPFYAAIIQGVEAECRRQGFRMLLSSSGHDPVTEAQQLEELSRQVAGVLILPLPGGSYASYTPLLERRVPFVFVDSYKEGLAAPLVATDNQLGGYQATRHLLEIGRRRIFVFSPGQDLTSFTERVQGYRRALREAGLRFDPDMVLRSHYHSEYAGFDLTTLHIKALRAAAEDGGCGILALNDRTARGALLRLREFDIQVPEQVAVVGFDDVEAIFLDPPLSSVRQETHLMGQTAARILIERLVSGAQAGAQDGSANGLKNGGQAAPEGVRIPPRLIVRRSSDASLPSRSPIELFEDSGAFLPGRNPARPIPALQPTF